MDVYTCIPPGCFRTGMKGRIPLRKCIIILAAALLLSSCTKAPGLDENTFPPSPSPMAEEETPYPRDEDPTPDPGSAGLSLSLEERMASLSFVPISGQYVRNSMQGDVKYTEMFVTDKSSFVRAASDESEEEVFAYNYTSDRFTYLYYFEGELLSKVVYDVGADTVLEDTDDLAELLKGEAQALKNYFYALLDAAGIGVEELQ